VPWLAADVMTVEVADLGGASVADGLGIFQRVPRIAGGQERV
jgi:hypothetical protein